MSGAGEYIAGRDRRDALVLDVDVVIVGSGAGGAVVACELAEAGQSVLVLEEGPHVPVERYSKFRVSESMRTVWRDGGVTVALGRGDTPMINVTMGRCVGGSSMLTGGVCFRVPEHVLDVWRDDRGLDWYTPRALEKCFESVERAVHVEEVPVAMRSRGTALFAEGATRRGFELEPMRRNTKGCNGCGRCNFGCPHGAKMSVDMTYLPRAIAAGARVVSDCHIEKIVVRGRRAVGVRGRLLDERGKKHAKVQIRAKRVVIAAGSVHTPAILRRSGIGTECGQLGKNMTLHPGFRVFARFDDPVRGWQGALQSAYSDAFMDERITLTGLFVPPGVLAATMPGFGPAHAKRTRDIPYLAMFGGMIHDEGGGELVFPPFGGEPVMTYRMDPLDRAAVPRIIRHMGETFFAAGAREVFAPVFGMHGLDADAFRKLDLESIPASKIECSSQHPLGTCRMGISAGNSVVDGTGAAWDVEELYLADGSIVPTSLGVNPQLTIMALATRVAWHLRDKKFAPMPD